MLTCECVNRLSGAVQGLHVITGNLSRQHSDSGLSRKTEGLSDQLHVRPTGVNDHHLGGRWMSDADIALTHLT